MKILSLNISRAKDVSWKGAAVRTGIFKESVKGRLMVRKNNIDGDEQADLTVHGGEFKAVYSYESEHYAFWKGILNKDLPHGMFGENFTTVGLVESDIHIGDRFRFGACLLEAVQPRLPCSKLGIRFGDMGIIRRFIEAGRYGTYYKIIEEGEAAASDPIELVERGGNTPVREIARLYFGREDQEGLKKILAEERLIPEWRSTFEKFI